LSILPVSRNYQAGCWSCCRLLFFHLLKKLPNCLPKNQIDEIRVGCKAFVQIMIVLKEETTGGIIFSYSYFISRPGLRSTGCFTYHGLFPFVILKGSPMSQIFTEKICVNPWNLWEKKSKIGLNILLLQIKTSTFIAIAIPLAIYKICGAVKIAIQYHFWTFFFCKDTGDNYCWIADEFVSAAGFKTSFIEVAKYLCSVLRIDLYGDGVDLAFCSEISFPGTTNFFGWGIGGFHKRWKQNGNYRY